MNKKQPQFTVNVPEIQQAVTLFSSFIRFAAKRYVSRQLYNSNRRKRTPQGPCGLQAPDRREVRTQILHHQRGRQYCSTISPRGMGKDRAQAGRSAELQPGQAEISRPHKLLRSVGRNGWPGTAAD